MTVPEPEPEHESEPEPESESKDDGKISGKWTSEPPGTERTRSKPQFFFNQSQNTNQSQSQNTNQNLKQSTCWFWKE